MSTSSQAADGQDHTTRPGVSVHTSKLDGATEVYVGRGTAAADLSHALALYVPAVARLGDDEDQLVLRFTLPPR